MTLIEIMVVVAIIVILVGIVVAVSSGIRAKALRSQTKHVFEKLDNILSEYERINGGSPLLLPTNPSPPTYPAANSKWTSSGYTAGTLWVTMLQAFPDTKSAMGDLPQIVGTLTVVKDAYGNPVLFLDGVYAPPAGYPTPPQRGFVSAGPDQEYGTADDMYSWLEK